MPGGCSNEKENRRPFQPSYHCIIARRHVFGRGCWRRYACTGDQRTELAKLRTSEADRTQGKVILVEFWTFGCYNCRNVEPHIKAWHERYADKGLVVIGVHSPEFNYERVLANVQRYVREHGIQYPIAIDNEFTTWKAYGNRYWPAVYLIDKRGVTRYLRIGEGGYQQTEQRIQLLLEESPGS